MKKVALGLSGGVDSSVSALLLQAAGYEVIGVYLECYREAGCATEKERDEALAVALSLNIKFVSLDFRAQYRQKVLDYFYQQYQRGLTPNPDVLCNAEIKFGLFYDWALQQGFDFLATGHYARLKTKIKGNKEKKYLYTAVDKDKDQTYFLALVGKEKWEKVIFPVGELTKTAVRELARQKNLPTANKKDSTGICFIGEKDIKDFLGLKVPKRPGIIKYQDKKIGWHQGAAFYTIGQRHGLNIEAITNNMPALFVIKKEMKNNILHVGEKKDCYRQKFSVLVTEKLKKRLRDLNNKEQEKVFVRVRHLGELLPSKIGQLNERSKEVLVKLTKPAFALAAGQFAVFYLEDEENQGNYYCLGGGEIV